MKLGPYELDQIYTGDARELAKAIPDESVDLIFCDPIFPSIDDYGWVAELGYRILRQGGHLIAESGHLYLPQILPEMNKSGLTWQTMLCEVFPLAWHRINASKTMTGWSPYLWFSKGARNGPWVFDRYYANGPDKSRHKWGDNVAFFVCYIEYLSNPNDVILDPFTGGGTIPAVCKMLGRHYLAFEIDPDTAERARQRVENTQPPLFVMQPEQAEMFAEDSIK